MHIRNHVQTDVLGQPILTTMAAQVESPAGPVIVSAHRGAGARVVVTCHRKGEGDTIREFRGLRCPAEHAQSVVAALRWGLDYVRSSVSLSLAA